MVPAESAIPLSRLSRAAQAQGRWDWIKQRVPTLFGASSSGESGQPPDASAGDDVVALSYIHSLHAYLAHLDITVSKTYLMGLSGDAFKFFYDPIHPARSMWVFLHNPLRAVCSSLALQHEITFFEKQSEALDALATHHETGQPAILQLGDTYPIVYPGLRVVSSDGEAHLTRGELEQQWTPSDGFLELGLFGHYLFTIGEPDQELKQRDIYLGAFRRARKIARIERRVRGCFIGLRAFDGMMSVLTQKRDLGRMRAVELERIADWNVLASLHMVEGRRTAVEFIRQSREAFEEEEELKAVDDAVKHYVRVVDALEQVRSLHPTLESGGPSKAVMDRGRESVSRRELHRFTKACGRAANSLEKAREAEDKGVRALGTLISVSEKTRM